MQARRISVGRMPDPSLKLASLCCQVPAGDIQAMTNAFNDKDTTIGNGLNIAGQNYEVHRWAESKNRWMWSAAAQRRRDA